MRTFYETRLPYILAKSPDSYYEGGLKLVVGVNFRTWGPIIQTVSIQKPILQFVNQAQTCPNLITPRNGVCLLASHDFQENALHLQRLPGCVGGC